jgi:hypothetical protein
MHKFRTVVLLICLVTLAVLASACASAQYSKNEFPGDPLQYLVGEWGGTLDNEWDLQRPDRSLIIYRQTSSPTLRGGYGVPARLSQVTIQVERYGGDVSIRFRSGAGSDVHLWLMRSGDSLILKGTLRTPSNYYRISLRKLT